MGGIEVVRCRSGLGATLLTPPNPGPMKIFLVAFRSGLTAAFVLLTLFSASAAFPRIGLEVVTQGELLAPVAIVNAGDGSGRLFIVEQRGEIRIIENGTLLPAAFLDIEAKLVPERPGFDERGLLGLAFHPDYASAGAAGEGKLYVYYSAVSPDATDPNDDQHPNPVNHMSVVAEYSVSAGDADLADAASERVLLTLNQPQFNHDAGQLAFGGDGLHKLEKDWGEAGSNASGEDGSGAAAQPGDATWNFTFFNTASWTSPGGNFAVAASATASVGASTATYNWGSPELAADVQSFLDEPATNFGWVLVGGESAPSTKRFDSSESTTSANRPKLKIDYTTGVPSNLQRWTTLFFDPGEQVDFSADLDNDQLKAIFEYGADLDPKAADPESDAYSGQAIGVAGGQRFQFRFRRDPRAVDLTYRVEESDDVLTWSTLAESIAGAAPWGTGVISDQPIVAAPPLRETVVETPITLGGRGFLRLVLILTE